MHLNQKAAQPTITFSIADLDKIDHLSALQSQALTNQNINHHYTPESALPVIDWYWSFFKFVSNHSGQ